MPLAGFRSLLSDLSAFDGRRLVLGVILAAVGAGLEGIGLLLLIPLLTAAGVSGNAASPLLVEMIPSFSLPSLLAIWVAVVSSHALFTTQREIALSRLNQDFVRFLRRRLHSAVLGMEWAAFQGLRSTDVVAALTGASARVGQGLANLVQLAARLLAIIVHVAIAAFLSPGATLLALAAGLALVVAQIPRLRRMILHGTAVGQGMQQVNAVVSEHVAAMKLAKCHNAEADFTAAFEREIKRLGDGVIRTVAESAEGRFRQRLAITTLLALAVWVAVEHLGIEGSRLLVLVAVFARLMPAIGDSAQAAQRVAEALPAYTEIETLRHRCAAAASPRRPIKISPISGSVVIRGVGYTWPGRNRPALSNLDLEIVENHTTALIGASGAGKSTLADICLGLLVPDNGSIEVGGIPLTGTACPSWRERTAVVLQDVFLFHDTVRANLAWAKPDATENEIWEALDLAAAADMIRALPQGLDTMVGDRGVRLSGGERQRLALARALLRRPAFLVLDEATSHLDGDNERLIQTSLDRLQGHLTVLVIAHRLTTIRHADTIAIMKDGAVAEIGTWEQLATSGGWLSHAAKAWDQGLPPGAV